MKQRGKKQQVDPMAEVYAARRANLMVLIGQHDGRKGLGEALGYSNGSFISQLTGPCPRRKISEGLARKFEVKLGLTTGWMDKVHAGA
jgi:hypothetical protein